MPAAKRRMRLSALPLLCLPALAYGLASDRDQPITIEADRATLKEKEGISVYQGNVYLNQGTLKLHGDTMTVYTKDDHIEKAVLTGNPATSLQRPDGQDVDQHAEARRMEYQATQGLMILTGAARVWQTDGKELRSEKITYNINKNTADAGNSSGGDRVHITLQPKPRETTAPEPAPSTSPVPVPAPLPAPVKETAP
jgi:lipopolysaccharide export system protein LptA